MPNDTDPRYDRRCDDRHAYGDEIDEQRKARERRGIDPRDPTEWDDAENETRQREMDKGNTDGD